jgi:hypothetical protein
MDGFKRPYRRHCPGLSLRSDATVESQWLLTKGWWSPARFGFGQTGCCAARVSMILSRYCEATCPCVRDLTLSNGRLENAAACSISDPAPHPVGGAGSCNGGKGFPRITANAHLSWTPSSNYPRVTRPLTVGAEHLPIEAPYLNHHTQRNSRHLSALNRQPPKELTASQKGCVVGLVQDRTPPTPGPAGLASATRSVSRRVVQCVPKGLQNWTPCRRRRRRTTTRKPPTAKATA